MPSADTILDTSTAIANEWRWLAVAWHASLAAIALVIIFTRASRGSVALALVLPIACVGVLSWNAGNPFNGVVFMLLALVLAAIASTMAEAPLAAGGSALKRGAGVALMVFGLCYPHFLAAGDAWWMYAYAAPFGLVPCPTLAVTAGASLLFGAFGSRPWAGIVATATLAYGAIGVAMLGVWIDVFLIAGGGLLLSDMLPVRVRRPLTA